MFLHRNVISYSTYILEIDPCGGKGPLVIQPPYRDTIDSSLLETDNVGNLDCTWLIKVKMDETVMIKVHNIKLSNR